MQSFIFGKPLFQIGVAIHWADAVSLGMINEGPFYAMPVHFDQQLGAILTWGWLIMLVANLDIRIENRNPGTELK